MEKIQLSETDGHVHDWYPGLGLTSSNYHLDESTPVSFHTHAVQQEGRYPSVSRNEHDDGWHTHSIPEER
ncbi:MAG TPA: hypothetical protein VLG09_00665 [Candidatus Saccharimonadales bacterium]|nr:hypothetical protein [Candidatus Saccharimonadales bacterium]